MAGPIIEPANFILIFLIFLLYFSAGIIIEPGIFRYYFWNRDDTVAKMCTLTIRFWAVSVHPMLLRAGSHHHSMGGKDPQVHEFVGLYSDPQCDAGSITAVVFIIMCSSDWTYFWTSFADSATSFADSVTSFADSVTMELVGLQRPSMRRRDYHGGSYICVLQIEPTSEQVSQTVLQVSQTVLQVSQTVLRWSWLAYSDPQCDAGTITAVVTYVFFRLNLLLNKFRRQCYKFRIQCYDGVGWTTATLNATQGLSRR